MDLHGNAALSWSGRRELARRGVEQGWTLTAAAEAAGVSLRCARKWGSRYGRAVGAEFGPSAVADDSRLAYAAVFAAERATRGAGSVHRAVAFYRRYGISVARVISGNGGAYRGVAHALACRQLGIKLLRTRP